VKNVDIAIIGGGMVGLSLAAQLAESHFEIALVNQGDISRDLNAVPEARVSALNIASESLLKVCGAWSTLQSQRFAPYTHMQVWDKDSFGQIDFSFEDTNIAHLGHIIENQNIVNALYNSTKLQSNLMMLANTGITQLELGQQAAIIHLNNGELLSARLVIGADGANSLVRKVANLPHTFWSYDQSAIVATVKTEQQHSNTARQVFTPFGPLAFLPLADPHYCSIVWSQQTAQATRLMSLTEVDFNRELSATLDMRLGLCELASQRHCIALTMRYARQWLGQRCVVIGDAAHTIHPLAGQGANLGFQDAQSLANALMPQSPDTLGDMQLLRGFERERKAEAAKMVATMEGFKQLFDGAHPLKKLARASGLAIFNRIPPIKHKLIQHAMGL
jgi:2-octaprenylphenol hydroxylase